MVATDTQTAQILGARLRAGKTWVSHLVQSAAAYLMTDPASIAQVELGRRTYAERSRILTDALAAQGLRPWAHRMT